MIWPNVGAFQVQGYRARRRCLRRRQVLGRTRDRVDGLRDQSRRRLRIVARRLRIVGRRLRIVGRHLRIAARRPRIAGRTSELLAATSELLPRARLAACSPIPPVIDVVPVVGARQRLVGSTVEVNVLAEETKKVSWSDRSRGNIGNVPAGIGAPLQSSFAGLTYGLASIKGRFKSKLEPTNWCLSRWDLDSERGLDPPALLSKVASVCPEKSGTFGPPVSRSQEVNLNAVAHTLW